MVQPQFVMKTLRSRTLGLADQSVDIGTVVAINTVVVINTDG